MNLNNIIKLLGIVLLCLSVGALGSIFTISEIPTWYAGLNKPFFNPPNWIFGPVWTTLYILMGISLYLVLEKKLKKEKNLFIGLFVFQLILNFLWSYIFFGLKLPLVAVIEIYMLWVVIFILIIKFYKFSKPAAYLLMPYLGWVSFASILNLFIVILN